MTNHCLVNQTMAFSAMSRLSLNPSKDSDSTTFLGNPFQYLTTLSMKNFLLMSKLEANPLVSYLGEEADPTLPFSLQVAAESTDEDQEHGEVHSACMAGE
ncbi:hypothetical protein DUI87_05709 [Hirundo rustica rustica]|uniref:Uncharacterized protein n=1 Tax=Hirundo rustica rustica TaxID=333673 RepID=A0A3M0KV01_HIRRU|nr:hypothetical protein DUI87_05709 [Hirundo rustica rustica]